MRKLREFGRVLLVCSLSGLCLLNLGCETLNSRSKAGEGVPADGLLGAKATALEHAMDSMSPEDRFYAPGTEYEAYGIMDPDDVQVKALIALLKSRQPPVVNATELYSRSSNSQWMDSRPAMRWTAAAEKDPENPIRAPLMPARWTVQNLSIEGRDVSANPEQSKLKLRLNHSVLRKGEPK